MKSCVRKATSFAATTCPARIGDRLSQVETPALVVKKDALERNMRRMTDYVKSIDRPVLLRPHTKTHKCPALAQLQIQNYGANGVCCQKLDEVAAMFSYGVEDVFLTNQCIGEYKIKRLCELAHSGKLSVIVDSIQNVRDIFKMAASMGSVLDVLIEVNGGQNRCGVNVTPDDAVLCVDIAREIIASGPALRFKGVHCYGGFLQHVRCPTERRQMVFEGPVANAKIAVSALRDAAIECEIVTGAGTGTYPYEVEGKVHNEIQAGSYCFMDVDYCANIDGNALFEHALFVHAMVVSNSVDSARRVVVDAGMKALSLDSGPPQLINGYMDGTNQAAGVEYVNGGDEHGLLVGQVSHLKVGDTVRLIPGHIDPTVNMHHFLVVVEDQADGEPMVVEVWDISGRGPGL